MALSNRDRVGKSLDLLKEGLRTYLEREPDNVVRKVYENCRTLKFKTSEFEKE